MRTGTAPSIQEISGDRVAVVLEDHGLATDVAHPERDDVPVALAFGPRGVDAADLPYVLAPLYLMPTESGLGLRGISGQLWYGPIAGGLNTLDGDWDEIDIGHILAAYAGRGDTPDGSTSPAPDWCEVCEAPNPGSPEHGDWCDHRSAFRAGWDVLTAAVRRWVRRGTT